jgi:hypothetical protein
MQELLEKYLEKNSVGIFYFLCRVGILGWPRTYIPFW